MPLSSMSLGQCVARSFAPVLWLAFILSVAANAFLLSRDIGFIVPLSSSSSSSSSSPSSSGSVMLSEPRAFGVLAISAHSVLRTVDASGAVLPLPSVKEFSLPSGLLPLLAAEMPVYTVSVLTSGVSAGASLYPLVEHDVLSQMLLSGALLPSPLKSNGKSMIYTAADIAYALIREDTDRPAYLVPVLRVSFTQSGCASCPVTTMELPLIDPAYRDLKTGTP